MNLHVGTEWSAWSLILKLSSQVGLGSVLHSHTQMAGEDIALMRGVTRRGQFCWESHSASANTLCTSCLWRLLTLRTFSCSSRSPFHFQIKWEYMHICVWFSVGDFMYKVCLADPEFQIYNGQNWDFVFWYFQLPRFSWWRKWYSFSWVEFVSLASIKKKKTHIFPHLFFSPQDLLLLGTYKKKKSDSLSSFLSFTTLKQLHGCTFSFNKVS